MKANQRNRRRRAMRAATRSGQKLAGSHGGVGSFMVMSQPERLPGAVFRRVPPVDVGNGLAFGRHSTAAFFVQTIQHVAVPEP